MNLKTLKNQIHSEKEIDIGLNEGSIKKSVTVAGDMLGDEERGGVTE